MSAYWIWSLQCGVRTVKVRTDWAVQPAIVSLSAGKFYMDPVADVCVVNAYARMELFLLLLDYNKAYASNLC